MADGPQAMQAQSAPRLPQKAARELRKSGCSGAWPEDAAETVKKPLSRAKVNDSFWKICLSAPRLAPWLRSVWRAFGQFEIRES
jgi:hypothetical protein